MTRFAPYAEPYDGVDLDDDTTRSRMRAAARRGDTRAKETLRPYDDARAQQRHADAEQRRADAAAGRSVASIRNARAAEREKRKTDR